MDRIPILIQGALSEIINGGGSGSGTIFSGGVEYELTWIEDEMALQLTNSETSDVQKIVLTGIGSGGGSVSAELSSDLEVTATIGGAISGKVYPAGTNVEDILRDILDPVIKPTFVAPSATLTAVGGRLVEKGGALKTTMTITFDRGSISTGGYRAGTAIGYRLNGGVSQASNKFSITVSESNYAFIGTVGHREGDQPKDSSGKNYGDPLPAGNVDTNTITYEFVNAIYANISNITTVAKIPLISRSAKQHEFNFPAQTEANPIVFDIPESWTVTAIELKNDLSGAWEDSSSEYDVTDVTHPDAGGTSVNYKRYTNNLGYSTGARSIRLKWN